MTEGRIYRVAGYVKLAKLWERMKGEAIAYHREYYSCKYHNDTTMRLAGVYIDITGQKQIYKRPEMLRLLKDCAAGKVDCIASQTKGYLAADSRELCYLLKYLFDLPGKVEIVTEDDHYRIDTIRDVEGQRQALQRMAEDFAALDPVAYENWKTKIISRIKTI